MIKIFRGGGRGGDTFKTPSPCEQLLPLPTPCFKMFLERSLNDPHPPPPHFKHPSLLPPPHPPPLPPSKNFDHTQGGIIHFKISCINAGINFIRNHLSPPPPPGTRLEGGKNHPPGQSLCTRPLPSGQNRESKAPTTGT